MNQEVNRKYEENAPNVYKLNSIDTKQIACSLNTQINPHLIHEFCAQICRLDSSSPHDILHNMFTTSIHIEDSIIMPLSNCNM